MLEVGLEPLREPPVGASTQNRTEISSLEGWSNNRYTILAYWSGRPGSNRRPQPWQGCALPTELLPQMGRIGLEPPTETLSLTFVRADQDTI